MRKVFALLIALMFLFTPVESAPRQICRETTVGFKHSLFKQKVSGEYVICTYRRNPPAMP